MALSFMQIEFEELSHWVVEMRVFTVAVIIYREQGNGLDETASTHV